MRSFHSLCLFKPVLRGGVYLQSPAHSILISTQAFQEEELVELGKQAARRRPSVSCGGGSEEMAYVPVCVQCGTHSNPCRCKVLGPTLGFVAFVVAGVVEWPLGAFVYLFRHRKGRRIMGHPANVVYPRITSAIPI